MLTIEPIGFFHSFSSALYDVPRQASLQSGNEGIIRLKSGCQFEQALEGLNGFDLIWILFRFHRHNHWKPKVLPPRGEKKQGVFATRSPHRPNFIGLSCVQLKSIQGLELFITNHDLIDGTPILDIKPYLNYADSFVSEHQGWLDELPPNPTVIIEWSSFAQDQIVYLAQTWNCILKEVIEHRIIQSPLPYANNRVKKIEKDKYELAYRTWRIYYQYKEGIATINYVKSGYDEATLKGEKQSKWEDVAIHVAFRKQFKNADIC